MTSRRNTWQERRSISRQSFTRRSVFKRHQSLSIDPSIIHQEEEAKNGATLEGPIKMGKKISGYKEVMCCDVHTSEGLIAVGLTDGTVDIRDAKKCNLVRTLDHGIAEDPKLPATALSFCQKKGSKDILLASYASGFSCIWNCGKSSCEWSIAEDRQTLANSWTPDYASFAVAGTDNKIMLYDVAQQSLIRSFESSDDNDIMDGHTMRIFAVKFHPTRPGEFVSGGWDNTVQFWDVRTPQAIRKINGPHICGEGIDFMEHGNQLLTASWMKNNSLQAWDYGTGNLLDDYTPRYYPSFLYCCRYNSLGKFILSGGGHNNIFMVIDVAANVLTANYRNLPDAVVFVRDLPSISSRDTYHRACIGFGSSVCIMEINI